MASVLFHGFCRLFLRELPWAGLALTLFFAEPKPLAGPRSSFAISLANERVVISASGTGRS